MFCMLEPGWCYVTKRFGKSGPWRPWRIFSKMRVSEFFPMCRHFWVVQRRVIHMYVCIMLIVLNQSAHNRSGIGLCWTWLHHPIQSLDIFGSPPLSQNIPKSLRWEAEDNMWIAQVTEGSNNSPGSPTAMCLARTSCTYPYPYSWGSKILPNYIIYINILYMDLLWQSHSTKWRLRKRERGDWLQWNVRLYGICCTLPQTQFFIHVHMWAMHIDVYSMYVCMYVYILYIHREHKVSSCSRTWLQWHPVASSGIISGHEVWASILVFSITVSFFASRGPLDRPSGSWASARGATRRRCQ